jgi:shikimate kinase
MEDDNTSLDATAIAALAQRIDRPIALVGMMGAGKSSVGRKLANLLGLPFVDADDEIEAAAQLSIPEIFEAYGEAFFRDGERRVIARLINGERKIIATGGGAFCNADTRALMLDRALVIWLDGDVETLLERVSRKDNRPLLKQGDPRTILTRLKAERHDAYAHAHIHVLSSNGPHSRTMKTILKGIGAWQ